jgi:hypothetical protein
VIVHVPAFQLPLVEVLASDANTSLTRSPATRPVNDTPSVRLLPAA